MVSQDLLDILRCPACVREKDGLLELQQGYLADLPGIAGAEYPIVEDIPVMLIDEGDKWANTVDEESLPIPPPRPQSIAGALVFLVAIIATAFMH